MHKNTREEQDVVSHVDQPNTVGVVERNSVWKDQWELIESTKRQAGGQGSVSKVVDKTNSERVGALKELHGQHIRDSERRGRMAQEVRALERLANAGVARVLDHNMDQVGDPSVALYLVQEWIDGQTLQTFIEKHPVSVDEALRITYALAEILCRCHELEIYHRDIKPDNIIITNGEGRKPMLVDFGIAWVQPEEGQEIIYKTEKGQELGNRWFRLPDNASGRSHRDSRTDVTMLVGILFHLLSRKSPRVIVDENGNAPHEAANVFPDCVRSDARWLQILRIFNVGFQPALASRFRSIQELYDRLTGIISPDQTKSSQGQVAQEYAALQDRVATKAFQEKLRAQEAIYPISRDLVEEWKRLMANSKGLAFGQRPGTPGATRKGYYKVVQRDQQNASPNVARENFWLSFTSSYFPQAEIAHTIQLGGESLGEVAAGYCIYLFRSDSEYYENFTWRDTHLAEATTYYSGPSADVDTLREYVFRKAEAILAEAMSCLRQAV